MLSKPEVSISFKFSRVPQKCNRRRMDFETHVIPAKAGIHSAKARECAIDGLDSRFRGNDWRVELLIFSRSDQRGPFTCL